MELQHPDPNMIDPVRSELISRLLVCRVQEPANASNPSDERSAEAVDDSVDSSDDVVVSSGKLVVGSEVVVIAMAEEDVGEVNVDEEVTDEDGAVVDDLVDDVRDELELAAELLIVDEVATVAVEDEHPTTTRASAVADDANTAPRKLR